MATRNANDAKPPTNAAIWHGFILDEQLIIPTPRSYKHFAIPHRTTYPQTTMEKRFKKIVTNPETGGEEHEWSCEAFAKWATEDSNAWHYDIAKTPLTPTAKPTTLPAAP